MKAAVVLPFVLLLAGCSMTQQILLKPDGSGTAAVQVHLGPLVVQYLTDILGSLGPEPPGSGSEPPLFDPARIRRAFAGRPGVRLVGLSIPTRSSLDLRLAFADINSIIPAEGQSSPLRFTTHDGVSTLRVELSRSTWPQIASLPPLKEDPILSSLGPQGGQPYSESEYLNLLEYAFDGYASKDAVRSAVRAATITVTVTVKGTLLAQSGGERTGNSVVFRIPLLRIATLGKPIVLSVSFK